MISISTARARRRAARSRFFATDLGARATQLVGNELADGVLQYFDPVERGRALAVNRRWRVVGARLEALDEAALWTQSALSRESHDLLKHVATVDRLNGDAALAEVNRPPPEDTGNSGAPGSWIGGYPERELLRHDDPLAAHLVFLWSCAAGARIEDDGTSTVSLVKMFAHLVNHDANARTLIIAPEAEMSKWSAALQELPPDVPVTRRFDAEFMTKTEPDSTCRVHLHLCTYEEAAENWESLCYITEWEHLILDEGDGGEGDWPWRKRHEASYDDVHDLETASNYVLYRPRHLTFEAATFHYYFVVLAHGVPFQIHGQAVAAVEGQIRRYAPLIWAANGDKFTRETLRRAILARLDASISARMASGMRMAFENQA